MPVRAMCRCEDVAILHRGAHTHLGRFLADCHMQEPRQVARPEPLLDLLLEAPDQEHFAEEVAEPFLGQRPPLLDFRHVVLSVLLPNGLRRTVGSAAD
jgi:hypothetical protein